MSRRERITQAAIEVFTEGGIHALTHRAVDAHAGLPGGSTSNVFRTRASLVGALAGAIGERRRNDGSVHDEALSLAWLELLIMARRDEVIAGAIAPMRRDMLALLKSQRTDAIPLSDAELAALLTGLEFASTVVGRDLRSVLELLMRPVGASEGPSATAK